MCWNGSGLLVTPSDLMQAQCLRTYGFLMEPCGRVIKLHLISSCCVSVYLCSCNVGEVVVGSAPAESYTAFVYMEDDTEISWPAMLSWAVDAAVLAPRGFQRGFFRTEVRYNGDEILLDAAEVINMTNVSSVSLHNHCDCRSAPVHLQLLACVYVCL